MNTRNTKQKQATMQALIALGHPTAAQLHAYLKENGENVGLSSVYRILNEGAQNGTVRRIVTAEADDIYDATLTPHSHVLCRLCKTVFDVPTPPLDVPLSATNEMGFFVESAELSLAGICKNCQNQ